MDIVTQKITLFTNIVDIADNTRATTAIPEAHSQLNVILIDMAPELAYFFIIVGIIASIVAISLASRRIMMCLRNRCC